MSVLVIDASVVAAAFFPEPHHDRAQSILASGRDMIAPDLLLAEVGNVIWKRHGRGELRDSEAMDLLVDVIRLPITYTPSAELVESALALALKTQRTVYDCLYLALAVRSGSTMVTGDQRLVNALADTPLASQVRWIGQA